MVIFKYCRQVFALASMVLVSGFGAVQFVANGGKHLVEIVQVPFDKTPRTRLSEHVLADSEPSPFEGEPSATVAGNAVW